MGIRKNRVVVFGSVLATLASLVSSLPVSASNAPPTVVPEEPLPGHARPPIYYTQVPEPGRPVNPSRGHGGTTSVVYTPANITTAYNYGTFADGTGQVIAIVDAYGDPNIVNDVGNFTKKYGLVSARINIIYPDGTPTGTNSGWATETALDVEWAHAGAPNAVIDLIVAKDSSFQSLLDGVQRAVDLGVGSISMSWGAPEVNVDATTSSNYEKVFQAAALKGILLFASSGDSGAYDGTRPRQLTPDFPSSSPEVTGVGGTTLQLNSAGGYGSEKAWSGSGGGYSTKFGELTAQSTAKIYDPTGMRGDPDVAFDADPNTGVSVYYNGSWYSVGGTSVGAPNWAAISADAASLHPLSFDYLYGTVYKNVNLSHDVISGSNGYYSAGTGWDAVTGIGTPNVANLIQAP